LFYQDFKNKVFGFRLVRVSLTGLDSIWKVNNISNSHVIILLFSRILVAIDGSESAKKAFQESIYLAQKCNSKLDVVHVVSCELGGDSAITFELIDELKNKAEKMLDEYKIHATKNNVPIEITIIQGDPTHVINQLAKTKRYDLIIMGNRGKRAFQELLIGSVSQKVMHHASCPVMVVR